MSGRLLSSQFAGVHGATSCVASLGWAVVALALGCLPDRELASYAAGGAVGVVGNESAADAPGPPGVAAPAPSSGDPGAESASTTLGSDGALDAGGPPSDAALAAGQDAAAPPVLACRAECECERRSGREFMFCSTVVTFEVAAERCSAAGGALASIDDAEQNTWLTERMQALEADDFWLSGTDAADEGVWRWADGRVFHPPPADAGDVFAPWDDQQPNDLNGEDCMRSIDGIWRDLACTAELTYVCQG